MNTPLPIFEAVRQHYVLQRDAVFKYCVLEFGHVRGRVTSFRDVQFINVLCDTAVTVASSFAVVIPEQPWKT